MGKRLVAPKAISMRTIDKARLVISRIMGGEQVALIQAEVAPDDDEWFRISAKAYSLHVKAARKRRREDCEKRNVSATSNQGIGDILELNEKLCAFAVCLPIVATKADLTAVRSLLPMMPHVEGQLLMLIEGMTLDPRIRALQNVGRIRHLGAFKEFAELVEAATLCYYRGNYASAYLTLIPVIEGTILRWSGYRGIGEKPEFECLRKFFRRGHVRQPLPGNPLFYDVFCKACDKIMNDHFFHPSQHGSAHAEFNRHQASHLLRDTVFATKNNCIRLFLLLDTMTEVYVYETHCPDPRWNLEADDTRREMTLYTSLQSQTALGITPERILLGPTVTSTMEQGGNCLSGEGAA